MAGCPYTITRGKRRGEPCGVKPRTGEYCSKHKPNRPKIDKCAAAAPPKAVTPVASNKKALIDAFNQLNAEWLDSSYKLFWDNAKRRFGCCRYTKQEISLSQYMLKLHGTDALMDTLKHEVAHACNYKFDKGLGHGKSWKNWAVKLGATPKACSKSNVEDTNAKYVMRNRETGEIYRRYYRKPRQIGYRPTTFLKGKRAETEGKIEVVAYGTPLGKTAKVVEETPRIPKYVMRNKITGEVYRKYYAKPARIGEMPTTWIRGKKDETTGKLETVPYGTPVGTKVQTVAQKPKYVLRNVETKEIYRKYYRTPQKIGKLPGEWIAGDKKATCDKLEIVKCW